MALAYAVFPYDPSTFEKLLCEGSHQNRCDIKGKAHKDYLAGYLTEIKAKTIVAEYEYIDHDYLEDYSSYYVKCFTEYNKKCTRLHFFYVEFDNNWFKEIIENSKTKEIAEVKDSYLGFIVVKPLPQTIIGRTCLKNYPETGGRRFPITRKYDANLFGIPLSVQSLAFQEQDQVAAACATSALWSTFHGTGKLFHHVIPSPVEITKAATHHLPAKNRVFPNEGLSIEQMAHGIRYVGLEPYLVSVKHEYILKSTVYAYAEAGIPLALGLKLFDISSGVTKELGGHAVAVTGYRMDGIRPTPVHTSGFIPKASRIDKIYVHDDQVGPFARMEFDGVTIPIITNGVVQNVPSISTSFHLKTGKIGDVRAIPTEILAPLYHKIRIRFESIEQLVMDADSFLAAYITAKTIPLPERFEWEIRLSGLNGLKTDILEHNNVPTDTRLSVLTDTMPKFIWRARAFLQNNPSFELLFDATDIEQGRFFLRGIVYDASVVGLLKIILSQPSIAGITDAKPSAKIFEWLRTS